MVMVVMAGSGLAGLQRSTVAISVSVVICLLYLWLLPFTVAGMAALIGIGTLAMMLLDRRDGVVTAGITTVVIMVVAALSAVDAWHQPILRLRVAAAAEARGWWRSQDMNKWDKSPRTHTAN